MQFLIRQDTIHAVVNMRSSDLWLGLPYDVFNFTMLAVVVAKELQVPYLGEIVYNVGSSHIYEDNAKDAALLANKAAGIVVGKIGTSTTNIEEMRRRVEE